MGVTASNAGGNSGFVQLRPNRPARRTIPDGVLHIRYRLQQGKKGEVFFQETDQGSNPTAEACPD